MNVTVTLAGLDEAEWNDELRDALVTTAHETAREHGAFPVAVQALRDYNDDATERGN